MMMSAMNRVVFFFFKEERTLRFLRRPQAWVNGVPWEGCVHVPEYSRSRFLASDCLRLVMRLTTAYQYSGFKTKDLGHLDTKGFLKRSIILNAIVLRTAK